MGLPKDPDKVEEYLRKQRESHKGIVVSEGTREKLRMAMLGNTHTLGVYPSEETRKKMSEAGKNRKSISEETRLRQQVAQTGHVVTEETRKKISIATMGRSYGPMSEEQRIKISESNKGRVVSEEMRNRISNTLTGRFQGENSPNFGRRHSEEIRKRMGESHKGNTNNLGKHLSEETKKKLSIARSNPSNETRQKMSASRTGKHPSKETIDKMSKQRKGSGNSRWKGGITPLFSQIRSSKKMQEWTRGVLERDGFKDWFSGCNGKLESHHIVSFTVLLEKHNIKSLEEAENCPELWDLNNGVTMLKSSHVAYHNMWGKRK